MGCSLHFYFKKEERAEYAELCRVETFGMTYSNAQACLNALGIQYDLENGTTFPIDNLISACFNYLNSSLPNSDNGEEGFQDGIMIHCGRRPGHITERIEGFWQQCLEAKNLGAVDCGFF